MSAQYFVYIVRCADESLYTGFSTDVHSRVLKHNAGKGAKYTKARRPVQLVYTESFQTKSQALSREWHIKQMTRSDKLKLIQNSKLKTPEKD